MSCWSVWKLLQVGKPDETMFSTIYLIQAARKKTSCFLKSAARKFITDFIIAKSKQLRRTIRVTLFAWLLSLSASVITIGHPSCCVMHRTSGEASTHVIWKDFWTSYITWIQNLFFLELYERGVIENARDTRRSTFSRFGMTRHNGCFHEECSAHVIEPICAERLNMEKKSRHRLYWGLQSHGRWSSGSWEAHPRGGNGRHQNFATCTTVPVVSEVPWPGAVDTWVTSSSTFVDGGKSLLEVGTEPRKPSPGCSTHSSQRVAYFQAMTWFRLARHTGRDWDRVKERDCCPFWRIRWRQGPPQMLGSVRTQMFITLAVEFKNRLIIISRLSQAQVL